MANKYTDAEQAEIERILAGGGDPDYEDDPAAWNPPPPLTPAEVAAIDAIIKRTGTGK